MRINIKATNIELTSAISDYATKKVEALNKYIDPADESVICDVEVGKTTRHHRSGDIFKAEVNIHIAGKYFYAVTEESDLYAAIDEVQDEIGRAIKSYREKRHTLLRRGGAQIKRMVKGIFRR